MVHEEVEATTAPCRIDPSPQDARAYSNYSTTKPVFMGGLNTLI